MPDASIYTEEAALIRGLRAHEDAAYRVFIDRFAARLFRVAYRLLARREEAQEILQEVLQTVMERIAQFSGDAALYTWCYRITVNHCLMRLRKRGGRREVAWEEILPRYENGILTETSPDWGGRPDDLFARKEVTEFVQACLEALPEEEKTAYVLKDVEGMTEDEVCRILECTKPAMKNRVHRARLFLRKRLEERYVR